jgi:hypothetical protein
MLVFVPPVVPVTLRATVQELFTASVPPLRLTEKPPATAVAVPPHVVVSALGVATTRPDGRVSVKDTPASATVFAAGLVIVSVRLVVPLTGMELAPNALAMLGDAITVTVAVAERPVPPSFEVMALVELFFTPAEVPVTVICNAQLEPGEPVAAKLKPEKVITLLEAEMVPPQVKRLGKSEVVRPAGSVSTNPTPVSAVELGLEI